MPIYGVANSAHVLVPGVTFQNLLHVRRIQRRTRDDPMGSRACRRCLATTLSRRLGSTDPIRFDVHGFDNVLVADIRQIILSR